MSATAEFFDSATTVATSERYGEFKSDFYSHEVCEKHAENSERNENGRCRKICEG